MSNNFQPGDIDIVKIRLCSDDGHRKYFLNAQARAIDIYESVTSPIVYARLYIDDAIDLARQFPIIAEEYVEIEFKLPNSEHITKYKLHVKSMTEVQVDSNQKIKSYVLNLVSMEMLEDACQSVDGRLAGYRQNNVLRGDSIDKAIGKILKDKLKTDKKYYYEETKGIDEVLLSGAKPFIAIDTLRRRSISKKYDSSSFCFFENQRGYVFSTLEKLFDEGRTTIGDKIFWTDTDTAHSATQNMFRNIIGYKQLQFVDSIDKINEGGLKNNVGSFDVLTGEYAKTEYLDSKDGDFKTVEGRALGQQSSSFTSKYSKTTSKTLFMVKDGSRSEIDFEKRIVKLQAYTQKIVQNLIHIHVWGDNAMTVGDVITCYLPEATGMTESMTQGEDRLSSGNFLVSKLVHKISLQSGMQKYTMACELIKGGILEK